MSAKNLDSKGRFRARTIGFRVSPEEDKLIMFDFDSGNVKKVDIINDSGTFTAEYDAEKGWQLTSGGEGINLNDSIIGAIAAQVSQLKADKILVVKDGTIAEQGTHDELLALGGVYRELYETQFRKVIEYETK